MTTEEKIFELLKYANNEAVGYARIAKEYEENGMALHAGTAKSISETYSDVVRYWESLNKK